MMFSTWEGKGKYREHWLWELRILSGQEDSARHQLQGKADLKPGTFTLTRWYFRVTGIRVPFIPIASFWCGGAFTCIKVTEDR